MILVIDNYDSFVHNIARYLAMQGAAVDVVRNDALTPDEIGTRAPEAIVISPGPCTPAEAGVSNAVLARFGGHVPILGVCLGHQCLGALYGGRVARAASHCARPLRRRAARLPGARRGRCRELGPPLQTSRPTALAGARWCTRPGRGLPRGAFPG